MQVVPVQSSNLLTSLDFDLPSQQLSDDPHIADDIRTGLKSVELPVTTNKLEELLDEDERHEEAFKLKEKIF